MKKLIPFLSFLFITAVAFAQEVAEEVEYRSEEWSDTTKWSLVGAFALIIVVLVFRTFRNKPEV